MASWCEGGQNRKMQDWLRAQQLLAWCRSIPDHKQSWECWQAQQNTGQTKEEK